MCSPIPNNWSRPAVLRPQPRRSSEFVGFRRAEYGRNHAAVAVPPASADRLPHNGNVCAIGRFGPEPLPEPPDFPEITCASAQASGGQGVESFVVNLGTDGGNVLLAFDAYGVPDRFTVTYGGALVIDTGYRGHAGYGVEIAGPGSGFASFVKPSGPAHPTFAVVTVYAPFDGTAWTFTLGCPA